MLGVCWKEVVEVRSVPACGLLDDMTSIRPDGQGGPHAIHPSSPLLSSPRPSPPLNHQHPSQSSSSTINLHLSSPTLPTMPTPASSSLSRMISPLNASGAFLPGLHSHRAAARKQGGASTGGGGGFTTASGLTAGLLYAGSGNGAGIGAGGSVVVWEI